MGTPKHPTGWPPKLASGAGKSASIEKLSQEGKKDEKLSFFLG